MNAAVIPRGSMSCPIPGCTGMLRPETNGMGRLLEICDACAQRTAEHARFGAFLRTLERRVCALEARASGAEPTLPVAEPSAPERTAAVRPVHVRRISEGVSHTILEVLTESGAPLPTRELASRVLARVPTTSRASISALIYELTRRRLVIASARDLSQTGGPRCYSIAPPPAS